MEAYLVHVALEGLYLTLLLAAPPVLASMAAGVLTGALQTATQVQEPTLTMGPKIAAVALSLVIAGPWIGEQLARFARALFEGLSQVGV